MQVSKFFAWIELYHNETGILVHIKIIVNMVSSKVDCLTTQGFPNSSKEWGGKFPQ